MSALRWLGSKSIGMHKSGWEWMYQRPFTALGVALAFVVCTRPQVDHIVADLPWPSWVTGELGKTIWGVVIAVAFVAAVAALIFAAVAGAVLVVPAVAVVTDDEVMNRPRWRRWMTRLARWIGGCGPPRQAPAGGAPPGARVAAWFRDGRFVSRLADLYPRIDAHFTAGKDPRGRHLLGVSFLIAAAVWLLAPLAWDRKAPIGGLMLRQLLLSLALAASGLWFLFRREVAISLGYRAVGRYVFMTALGLVAGEIIWSLPGWTGGALSFRFFTIWGVLFLLFIIIATGRLIDRAKPVVRLALLVTGIVVSQVDAGFVVDAHARKGDRAALANAESVEWFTRLEQRIGKGRADHPVVLVAASGGGSRAAIFASLVLEHLGRVRFDGEAAAKSDDSIAHNIAVISSVSGGSLAAGYYLRQLQDAARERFPPHNFSAPEVARHIVTISEDWAADADACKANIAGCIRLDEDELVRQRRLEALPNVRRQVAKLQSDEPSPMRWLVHSPFVDDMATDFMAPLLRGVLTPFLERGHSVSVFWSEHFGWNGFAEHGCWNSVPTEADALTCDWFQPRPPPLAFLNTTDVKTGRRVVIGYPSLPQRLLGTEITSLSDHGGTHDVALADGVRLSANFPWGFEVGLYDRTEKADRADTAAAAAGLIGQLKLTDGGVTDNSGLDTLATLLERLELLARPPKAEAEPVAGSREEFLATRARVLRDRLVKQGVMLIEIDSGARPSTGGLFASLFPGVADPLDALSLAGYGGAATMKAGHIARMQQALERMAGQVAPAPADAAAHPDPFFHLRFECNHKDSVMTAWALGPMDKAKIMTLFLVEAEANRAALAAHGASAKETTSETRAADLEGTDRARRMAQQVVQELRRGEEDRQLEAVENPVTRQDLIREVIAAGNATNAAAAAETPPAAQEQTQESPAKSVRRSGWVYLGHYDAAARRWLTTYLTLPGHDTLPDPRTALAAGSKLVAGGRVNIRPSMPADDGRFAPVQSVLRKGTAVTLSADPKAWLETGFVWAPVDY